MILIIGRIFQYHRFINVQMPYPSQNYTASERIHGSKNMVSEYLQSELGRTKVVLSVERSFGWNMTETNVVFGLILNFSKIIEKKKNSIPNTIILIFVYTIYH